MLGAIFWRRLWWRSSLRSSCFLLEMPEDPVDHPRIGQKRDDPHRVPALAQERIGFVDPPDQPSPLSAESPSLRCRWGFVDGGGRWVCRSFGGRDHRARCRRIDVGIDDKDIFFVDNDGGIAVDGPRKRIVSRVDIDPFTQLLPGVSGIDLLSEAGRQRATTASDTWRIRETSSRQNSLTTTLPSRRGFSPAAP